MTLNNANVLNSTRVFEIHRGLRPRGSLAWNRFVQKVDEADTSVISCEAAARAKPRATLWEPWEATARNLEPRSGDRAGLRCATSQSPLRGSQTYCARSPRLAKPRLRPEG